MVSWLLSANNSAPTNDIMMLFQPQIAMATRMSTRFTENSLPANITVTMVTMVTNREVSRIKMQWLLRRKKKG